MPSGSQLPLSHTRLDGPSSSKPRSHEYDATVPLTKLSLVNTTTLWAGDPGKLHDLSAKKQNKNKKSEEI